MSWEIGEYQAKYKHWLELPKPIYLSADLLNDDGTISGDLMRRLIDKHKERVPRYRILQRYYENWARIYDRTPKESYKPDNRLVTPYPSYIVDILHGLTIGRPINYVYENPDDARMQSAWEDLQATLDYNDEHIKNSKHLKNMGIKGHSYEMQYTNKDKETRIAVIDPENAMVIYDDTVEPEPLFALHIRYNVGIDGNETLITLFTDEQQVDYKESENGYVVVPESAREHYFEEVPITEIVNNPERIGDFERVLPLIDAMNISQSDTANDFEEFTDALLVLYGMLQTNSEDVEQLLKDGVLLLEEVGGKQGAEWLIKEINDAALENHKNRLDDHIHKFSKVPNMSDESFAGNQSGVTQDWKMLATEQVITQKRTQMRSALYRRLRLMINNKSKAETHMEELNYKDITITFQDNKPLDKEANVKEVKELIGTVSTKTALSRLYFMEDVDKEIEAIEQERNAYADAFNIAVKEDDNNDEEED